MIVTTGLCRRFGSVVALEPLTLTLEGGAVIGVLGGNGAGKTTLLSMLATLLLPTEGTAEVRGHDVVREPLEVRRLVGYVPEHASVYEGLTADEYLELCGRIRGMQAATLQGRADRLLAHLGLAEARKRRLGTFSKGMRGKVLLAAALLHDPAVLILDEPLSGLDVASQALVGELLREMARNGRTILYSSHVLEQVESHCDVLLLLHAGKLLWHGSLDDLRAGHDGAALAAIFLAMTAGPDGGKATTWSELLGPASD